APRAPSRTSTTRPRSCTPTAGTPPTSSARPTTSAEPPSSSTPLTDATLSSTSTGEPTLPPGLPSTTCPRRRSSTRSRPGGALRSASSASPTPASSPPPHSSPQPLRHLLCSESRSVAGRSLLRPERSHIDREPVLHVRLAHPHIRFPPLLDRDHPN